MANTNSDPTIDSLFRLLDQWRHLPAYGLENRVDPFFALFLPEILKARFDVDIDQRIIPEFPLKKDQNRQSTKVDYFALSRKQDRAFLIELKTDMHSMDDTQIEYLKSAAGKELHQILCGLRELCTANRSHNSRKKYFYLLRILADLHLVTLPPDLEEKICGGNPRGVYECMERIGVTPNHARPEIVYILPDAEGGKKELDPQFNCIGFKYIAGFLKKRRGEIRQRFAECLENWIEPAGTSACTD